MSISPSGAAATGICQWDVLEPAPDVPLPRPRPSEAPTGSRPAD